jgi:predicted nucleotidyltransferase
MELAKTTIGLKLYLFGSSMRGATDPADIDLLVVYRDPGEARQFRRSAEKLELVRPLHLVAMTTTEEAHYSFIERTEATPLSTIISTDAANR